MLILALVLAAAMFLFCLNGYLRGRLQQRTSIVLGWIILGMWAAVLIRHGWRAGLAAVVGTFVFSWIVRPVAAAIAHRMLGYHTDFR